MTSMGCVLDSPAWDHQQTTDERSLSVRFPHLGSFQRQVSPRLLTGIPARLPLGSLSTTCELTVTGRHFTVSLQEVWLASNGFTGATDSLRLGLMRLSQTDDLYTYTGLSKTHHAFAAARIEVSRD